MPFSYKLSVPGLKRHQTFTVILPNLIQKSKKRNLTRRIACLIFRETGRKTQKLGSGYKTPARP